MSDNVRSSGPGLRIDIVPSRDAELIQKGHIEVGCLIAPVQSLLHKENIASSKCHRGGLEQFQKFAPIQPDSRLSRAGVIPRGRQVSPWG